MNEQIKTTKPDGAEWVIMPGAPEGGVWRMPDGSYRNPAAKDGEAWRKVPGSRELHVGRHTKVVQRYSWPDREIGITLGGTEFMMSSAEATALATMILTSVKEPSHE